MVVKEKTDTKRYQKETAGPRGQQAMRGVREKEKSRGALKLHA